MSAGDVVGDQRRGPLADDLGDAANVLVLSPVLDETARRAYYESFVPADPSDTRVLAVDYTRSPAEWIEDWQSYVGQEPAACAVVSVGDGVRSAATAGAPPADWMTHGVETPDDLTGLGITIGEYLSEWSGEPVLVIFDSVTVLLQYVDLQRAFRFLHVMTNRAKTAGAESHYHMDPEAHDDRTIATLSSVFDAVVEFSDGEWTVRSR